jgi:hypothetical protein
MTQSLIQAQDLADSFVSLLGSITPAKTSNFFTTNTTGSISPSAVPSFLQNQLSQIFSSTPVADHQYRDLFYGDISRYEGDHSAADLALIGYFSRNGLSPSEADQVFRASKLFRGKWDEMRGNQTYGELTIAKAFEGLKKHEALQLDKPINKALTSFKFGEPSTYHPTYLPQGVPARTFVGPKICSDSRLFPAGALSSLVALGGVGKTSILLSIAAHVAAGKSWNNHPLQQQKVAMFFCEENIEEINRKFGAIVENWLPQERDQASKNLLTVSLLGEDARLTIINKNQYSGTGIAEEVIALVSSFGLKNGLIIFDHMQGFTSGDLNLSETATTICREANKVVDATGAAVVLAAHISKANINATALEQGFAVGSLAFENATRQMAGMLPMSIELAKKYGLEEYRKDYVWLSLAKNSYGDPAEGLWLHKLKSKKFHTITFEPVLLHEPISSARLTENEKLYARIVDYISRHPFTTRNMLDKLSGTNEEFKASKSRIRDAIKGLIDSGEVAIHAVTEDERLSHSTPKQVTHVLRANNVKAACKEDRQ